MVHIISKETWNCRANTCEIILVNSWKSYGETQVIRFDSRERRMLKAELMDTCLSESNEPILPSIKQPSLQHAASMSAPALKEIVVTKYGNMKAVPWTCVSSLNKILSAKVSGQVFASWYVELSYPTPLFFFTCPTLGAEWCCLRSIIAQHEWTTSARHTKPCAIRSIALIHDHGSLCVSAMVRSNKQIICNGVLKTVNKWFTQVRKRRQRRLPPRPRRGRDE